MFDKQNESQKSPTRPSAGSSGTASVIGPTLSFVGELSAQEDLIIEGKIEGTIKHQKRNLTVGKQGRVKADIHAMKVIIEGTVEGDVRGDELVLLAKGSKLTGNISSPRVSMEDGAIFKGKMSVGTDAPDISVAPEPKRTGT